MARRLSDAYTLALALALATLVALVALTLLVSPTACPIVFGDFGSFRRWAKMDKEALEVIDVADVLDRPDRGALNVWFSVRCSLGPLIDACSVEVLRVTRDATA